MNLFQQNHLFANLTPHQLNHIVDNSKILTLQKESILFMEGNTLEDNFRHGKKHGVDANLYLIKMGSFKILKKFSPNKQSTTLTNEENELQQLMMPKIVQRLEYPYQSKTIEISVLGPGQLIGLEEIINKENRRRYTVIANDTDCQIYRIRMSIFGGIREFMDLCDLKRNKQIQQHIIQQQTYRNDRQESIEKIQQKLEQGIRDLNLSSSPSPMKKAYPDIPKLNLNNDELNYEFKTPSIPHTDLSQTQQITGMNKLSHRAVSNNHIRIRLKSPQKFNKSLLLTKNIPKRNYCSSRIETHDNGYEQNYDMLVEKKIQVNNHSVVQEYSKPILEDLVCHDENSLKMYRLKIGLSVRSTMQTFRRDHIGKEEENDLAQFKVQRALEDQIKKANMKGIHFNRLREYSCGDNAYLVFDQYKDQMIKYWNNNSNNMITNRGQSNDITKRDELLSMPSRAVKNTKRKLKHSRRQIIKNINLNLNQQNFI